MTGEDMQNEDMQSRSEDMQSNDALQNAYRATFQDYSRKLDALQRLTGAGGLDNNQLEVALLDVEKARVAHNHARDRLASDLMRLSPVSGGKLDERHIRKTARLLWELAGRPDGSAERDWRQAEQLVHAAASCAG
jgi:hypothetical protein